jgi:hypothetical protein
MWGRGTARQKADQTFAGGESATDKYHRWVTEDYPHMTCTIPNGPGTYQLQQRCPEAEPRRQFQRRDR